MMHELSRTFRATAMRGSLCAILCVATTSHASEYPLAVNERPMTLPNKTFSLETALQYDGFAGGVFSSVGLISGAAFALTDEWEIGASAWLFGLDGSFGFEETSVSFLGLI